MDGWNVAAEISVAAINATADSFVSTVDGLFDAAVFAALYDDGNGCRLLQLCRCFHSLLTRTESIPTCVCLVFVDGAALDYSLVL